MDAVVCDSSSSDSQEAEIKASVVTNNSVDLEKSASTGSPSLSSSPTSKGFSPTIIEQAFNVMKNLFSPDKSRSKSSSILNPNNNQVNTSPYSSIYSPNKTDLSCSEGDVKIKINVQHMENNLNGDNVGLNQLGLMAASFQNEAHNTTDDSFTTTVSRIDESFQSTITHIEDNTGQCKSRESGASIILNDSQDLGILNESSNETLENSQTIMDSTLLKNGGFELELKEISENLENTHVTEEIDTNSCGSNENTSGNSTTHETSSVEKYHSDSLSSENLQNEAENKISQSTYDCLNDENNTFLQSKHHRQNSGEKFSPKFDQQSSKASEENLDEEKESNLTSTLGNELDCEFVENNAVENLFVNTTFEGSAIESSILKNDVSCSKLVNQDSRKIETLLQVKKDVASEISCNEKANGIENTISTTTIVLDSVGSADFNKMLKSLKQDDSSVTSFEGSDESCSLENIKETEPKGKSQRINCDLSNTPAQSLYKISNCGKACSRSLGSSFNKSPRLKRKMSKSVDLDSSKSPKSGKKLTLDNKKSLSSADLSKFEGVEKIISLHPPSDERMSEVNRELKTILSPFVLNVEADKVNLDFENSSQFDFGNSQAVLCPEERDSVSVMSQQSYTVLTSLNKNLERPIIKSDENLCGDFKEDIQTKKYSPFRENADKENVKIPCDKVKTLRAPKNSSPNGEAISISKSTFSIGSTQTYVKPTSSAMKSSCFKKESCVGLDNAKGYSKADLLSKAMKIFSSSEDSSEVTNIVFNDSQFAFDNSETQVNYQISNPWVLPVKCFRENIDKQTLSGTNQSQKLKQAVSSTTKTGSPKSKLNVTFETNREPPERRKSDASVSNKLNQTYDKKSLSPEAHELNQTYDKKSESPTLKFNQTYDKKQESPPLTLNQTYDKKQESPTIIFNQTYEKKQESPAVKFNETYDKQFESPKLKMNETFDITNKYANIVEDSSKTQETNSFEKKVARVEPTQTLQNVEKTQETEFSFIGNLNSPNEKNVEIDTTKNLVDSSTPLSSNAPLVFAENLALPTVEGTQQLDELVEKVADINLNDNLGKKFESEIWCDASSGLSNEESDNVSDDKSSFGLREGDELFQLIQEQFSPTDIEKICSVVEDIAASKRLSSHILKASQEFDKSFHESFSNENKKPDVIDALTPQGLEYLDSIKGKPSGRDFSRESLYVKFDPLVQIPPGSTLIDFTKEGEILPTIEDSPKSDVITNDCERIFSLSPKNKSDGTVPPLTPLSSKKNALENEKEKLKNLQNEIYFLKNMYAEREKVNQSRLEDFEAKITKLTGDNCVLEDRLKGSKEREKSLVKKLSEQTQSINKLKCVMEEYVRVIQKLSDDYDVLKTQSAILVNELSTECNSFKEHLQNTEAAFSDVHAKYERSKKTISNLKANEAMYKRKISEQTLKLEEYKHKAEEAQEKALVEFMKVQEQLNEAKKERNQETTRLRAQLRKAELKLETLQESLDQKIKENQELTAICDELIEGKK